MITYVKKHDGYDVPEGATHYQAKYQDLYAGFYKKVHDAWFFFNCSNTEGWVLESSADDNLHGMSLKLKLRDKPMPSKAEWIPTGRCIHLYNDGGADLIEEEVVIVGVDKDGFYVFQNDKSTCYYSDAAACFVKPKTAEEKKREAFHLKALEVYSPRMSCNEFATALYEAGFTEPKAEK